MGFKFALIFVLVVYTGQPLGIEAVPEVGASTFGYDASSSCSKPARMGRSRISLPCDFRQENWCTIAGNAYPWQAVRRFVQENQGLMRRMYGDEKHISVLKTELEKNDVEIELENNNNQLYSDDTSSIYRQFQSDDDYDLDQSQSYENEEALENRDYYGRSLSTGTSSKFDKLKNEDTRHHPNETPIVSTTIHSTSSIASTTTATSNPSTTSSTATRKVSHRTKITPVTTTTTTTTSKSQVPISSTKSEASVNVSSTTPIVTLAQIANIQNLSINEIPGKIDRFDANVDELTEIPDDIITVDIETTLQPDDAMYISSSERNDEFFQYDRILDQDSEASEPQQQHKFGPRPEYRPSVVTRNEVTSTPSSVTSGSMEGQLFQDVAAKEKPEPVLKVRGINACPVKEEVVAPFWANNTRGEVLALLNLYPFEQYVHWEKCTDENKQMYCRDGCRCEQQYRLHRLLAYDPNNECRGIFSDWFKFPSCCICRCYDLPLEFRVTSRSPRNLYEKRQRIKVKAPQTPPKRKRHN